MKSGMKKLMVFVLTVVMLVGSVTVAEAASTYTTKIGAKEPTIGSFGDGKIKSTTLTLKVPAGVTKIYISNTEKFTAVLKNSDGKKLKSYTPQEGWGEGDGDGSGEITKYELGAGIKLSKGTYKIAITSKSVLSGDCRFETFSNKGGTISYDKTSKSGSTSIAVTKEKSYKFTIKTPVKGMYKISSGISPYSGSDFSGKLNLKIKDSEGKEITPQHINYYDLDKGTYTIEITPDKTGVGNIKVQGAYK